MFAFIFIYLYIHILYIYVYMYTYIIYIYIFMRLFYQIINDYDAWSFSTDNTLVKVEQIFTYFQIFHIHLNLS